MSKRPLLVLIDGSAIFHRGYHAIPHLTNKEGEPTNATFGFATILLKVLQDLKPQYAVVTWDKSEVTFRKEKYPDYKANRVKQPDDLYAQIPDTRALVEALNLPWIELSRYEADDIIGTLAAQAKGVDTIIVTGDLDELQLVNETTRVYSMKRGFTDTVIYDIDAVRERYGVTPSEFIDVKALKGDTSDNIPGVAGIGEKTAVELIAKYGSLDAVYQHLDELKPALRTKLEQGKDMAYLSQDLSTIVCDAPVSLELAKAEVGRYDRQAIHELFRRLDFRSLLAKLPPELKVPSAGGEPTLFGDEAVPKKARPHIDSAVYMAVTTKEQLTELVQQLEQQTVFAFDTETDSLDTFSANLVGLSFAWEEGRAFYVPVGHTDGTQLTCEYVTGELKAVMEDLKIGKVGHNVKFDYEVLGRYGIKASPVGFDTMVASFILNPLGRSRSLDDLAYDEFGIEMIPISEMIGTGRNQISFDRTLIEDATTYAAEDADITWRLYAKMEPQIRQQGFQRLVEETEWPVIPILAEMEMAGIELDTDFLKRLNKRLTDEVIRLDGEICKLAGERFNIGSPSQLAHILFDKLDLPKAGVKKGKTGYSTAADQLEKLQGLHPIIDLITQYRELDKLKNTYVDALPKQVKADGRVHTSFSQTIAQTGRLSSNNPNLQNIPVRTEIGREIRQAFVAPKGRVLVSGDYSQIELRVAAALSHDEAMIETFKKGVDLHAQTAAELYGVPLEEVTKEQRAAMKAINFGVLYGMSAHGLSVATGMTREEAAGFIERYWTVRPQLAKYIEDTKKFAHEHEYTATLFGRKRPCPEINSNNFMVASSTERMAVNVPIQGTAADIYKVAMIALDRELDDSSKLLLQIHDELIVETDEARGEEVAALMKRVMEQAFDLGVPLVVDTAVGKNWGEL